MIHLDQLEFLPIFPYSELLIWMLPAPNVTDHSYFDSIYLKKFTALSFLANKRLLSFYQCIVLEDCSLMLKKPSDLQHTDLPRTGSYMGSADT